MSYAIIGLGKIGTAIAHAFAREGIEVTVAAGGRWTRSRRRSARRSFPGELRTRSRPTSSSLRFPLPLTRTSGGPPKAGKGRS